MKARTLIRTYRTKWWPDRQSVNQELPDGFAAPLATVREAMRAHPEVFDIEGYLEAYPDVASAGVDALDHYLARGYEEGRRPVGTFDADGYLRAYQDVALSGVEPLTHYLLWGIDEGRSPRGRSDKDSSAMASNPNGQANLNFKSMKDLVTSSGLFDVNFYCEQGPDVVAAGIEPIVHYLEHGESEGRRPNPWFDPHFYRVRYMSVAIDRSALVDYIEVGSRLLRDPSQEFSSWHYWKENRQGAQGDVEVLHWHLHTGRHHGHKVWAVPDSDPETIINSGAFDTVDYRRQQGGLPENDWDLAVHYLLDGSDQGLQPNRFFDSDYYLDNNAHVRRDGINPFVHFLRFGWKELCNPSVDFDVWWYWTMYMDPTCEEVNPLAHFQGIGAARNFKPRPTLSVRSSTPTELDPAVGPVRRACLFAGYDPEDRIDDYVVDLIAELSRHAEVYYLADGQMAEEELDKVLPYAKGAWSIKHGAYDFGSYARLANEFVGWDRLDDYDEVLLVNDSVYLLGPLDDVFDAMRHRDCDWWGLQATKGIAATRFQRSNLFAEPIPMDVVLDHLVSSFDSDYTYDFLIGSYFLALRKDVIRDEEFRRFLSSVRKQPNKKLVIQKYEIGLTRLLLYRGYRPATYIEDLYPFHPIFTGWYFALLDQGFPVLKRYFLTQNHYKVPNLHLWERFVSDRFPGVNVNAIKANLSRHLPREEWCKRWRAPLVNLLPAADAADLVAGGSSRMEADLLAVKDPREWLFFVEESTSPVGDLAMLLAETKRTSDVSVTVVSVDGHVPAWIGVTRTVALGTTESARAILGSAVALADSPRALSTLSDFATGVRLVVDLTDQNVLSDDRAMRSEEHVHSNRPSTGSIALAETVGEAVRVLPGKPSLSFHDVWLTGHPRRDLYSIGQQELPEHLREPVSQMSRWAGGRPLILVHLTGPDSLTARLVAKTCWHMGACAVAIRYGPVDPQDDRSHVALPGDQTFTLDSSQRELVLAATRVAAALVTDSPSVAFEMAGSGLLSLLLDNDNSLQPETIFGADWLALEAQGLLRRLPRDEIEHAVNDLLAAATKVTDPSWDSSLTSPIENQAHRSQRVIRRLRQAAVRLPFTPALIRSEPGAV